MKKLQSLWQIDWEDASTSHGWEDNNEVKPDREIVTTVGFLIKRSKASITIASTISEGTCNSRITIPMGMVRDLREIKVKYQVR